MTAPKQKPLYLLKRRPTTTHAQFTDHWLNVHAAVLKSIPEWSRLRSGYVQNHLIDDGRVGDWCFPYDGVTQVYVRPGTEGGPTFPELPVFREKVIPDELSFLDRERTVVLKTHEHIILPGSAAVKVLVFHRRRAGASMEEFVEHWSGTHSALVLSLDAFTSGLRGYRQNHSIVGAGRYLSSDALASEDQYDGASEFWFDSAEAARAAFDTSAFRTVIYGDPSGHFEAKRELACLVDPIVILPE